MDKLATVLPFTQNIRISAFFGENTIIFTKFIRENCDFKKHNVFIFHFWNVICRYFFVFVE